MVMFTSGLAAASAGKAARSPDCVPLLSGTVAPAGVTRASFDPELGSFTTVATKLVFVLSIERLRKTSWFASTDGAADHRELGDGQVKLARGSAGRVDRSPEVVAPRALTDRDDGERRCAARGRRADRGCLGQGSRSDAYGPRLGPAVQKELLDRVARFAVGIQPAELAAEVAHAEELDGLVQRPALEEVDERRDRGRDAGDGAHAAGNLLDVDARIGWSNWH